MSRRIRVGLLLALGLMSGLLAVQAADKLSEKWQKRLDSADGVYHEAVQKADNTRFYAVQKANADRVKVLKSALADATKAGDFDAATAIKQKLAEAEAIGVPRAKPKNMVKFEGHEYALIDEKATYHVAQRICEEMGGHLAIVDTPQKRQFAANLCGPGSTWFGASDEVQEGVWKWVDGRTVTDRSWITFEQQEINHFLYFEKARGRWFDGQSEYRVPFVCEWD